MSSDDTAFLEVLAGCTEAASTMDLSDDGFNPPDGIYTVLINEVVSGTKHKNGIDNAWVKPVFTILDNEEFDGNNFTNYFWIPSVFDADKPPMGLKRLLQFATLLSGTEVRNPIEAIEVANAAVGELISIEVYRTPNKNEPGKPWVNTRYLRKLVTTEGEITEAEEAGANAIDAKVNV